MIDNNKTLDIYNNLSLYEKKILNRLNIPIKKEVYSKKEFEYLCMDIVQYYEENEKLNLLNISIDEYDIIIEKMYEFEQFFLVENQKKGVNLYRKLTDKEKFILKSLFIKIDDRTLTPFEINQIINYINNQKNKLLNISISQNDFIYAYKDYAKKQVYYFKDEDSITNAMLYNKWPIIKYNIYNSLSIKSIYTIKKLGINIENKEIDSHEYLEILQKLIDNLLNIFNTKISKNDCEKLISKFSKYL